MMPTPTIKRLFTQKILERLQKNAAKPSKMSGAGEAVRQRHVVLGSTEQLEGYEARRQSWETYLAHADRCGLLEDLIPSLTGVDDDAFRGAMAECLTAWFMDEVLGFRVTPKPPGRDGKCLDLAASRNDVGCLHIEVKAPFVELARQWRDGRSVAFWSGDDSSRLQKQIEKAARQFSNGNTNVLVVVPMLRQPIHLDREQLVKATIGEHVSIVTVNLSDNMEVSEPRDEFRRSGRLVRYGKKNDGSSSPVLTRISAVASIEETLSMEIDVPRYVHKAVVVHNPHAECPMSESVFSAYPQLICRGDELLWMEEE